MILLSRKESFQLLWKYDVKALDSDYFTSIKKIWTYSLICYLLSCPDSVQTDSVGEDCLSGPSFGRHHCPVNERLQDAAPSSTDKRIPSARAARWENNTRNFSFY